MAMVIYPQLARPISTVFAERITPDKWQPIPNQPVYPVAQPQHLYTSRPITTFFPERASADKWYVVPQQPRLEVKQPQHLYYAAPTLTPAPIVAPSVAGWMNNQFLVPAIPQPQYLYFATSPSIVYPERATPDKWQPIPQQPIYPPAQPQYLYYVKSPSTLFSERVSVDKWFGVSPTIPEVKRPQYLEKAVIPFVIQFFSNQIAWYKLPEQPTYPPLPQFPASNVLPTRQPVPVSLGAILTSVQVPVRAVQQPPYQGLALTQVITNNEIVTVDKWYSLPQIPVRSTPISPYISTSTFVSIQVTPPGGGTLTLLLLGVGR